MISFFLLIIVSSVSSFSSFIVRHGRHNFGTRKPKTIKKRVLIHKKDLLKVGCEKIGYIISLFSAHNSSFSSFIVRHGRYNFVTRKPKGARLSALFFRLLDSLSDSTKNIFSPGSWSVLYPSYYTYHRFNNLDV